MKPKKFKTFVVDITPSGLAHTARTAKDPCERFAATFALNELIGLIHTLPEKDKPAHWKGW